MNLDVLLGAVGDLRFYIIFGREVLTNLVLVAQQYAKLLMLVA